MAKFLGFNFGENKINEPIPTLQKINENVSVVNSFTFASDNQFLPSDYNYFTTSNGYVRYGLDNYFPNRLADLFYSSPLHQTAIKLKSLLVSGDGVEVVDGPNKVSTELFLNTIAGADNIEKLISDLSLDYRVFGSYHLLITWNASFNKIIKVERLPSFGCRYAIDYENRITDVKYSSDWKYLHKSQSIKSYPVFNVLNKECQQQVLVVRNTSIDNRVYSVPDYASGLNSIAANAAISLYQLSVVENGFSPGLAIKFLQIPSSPEEQAKIVNGIKKEYSGKRNGGKVLFMFGDGKDNLPIIEPIETTNLDKQYTVLTSDLNNNIIYSHNIISPALLGVASAGKLGDVQELQNGFMLLEKTVIKKDRKLIQDSLNKVLKLNAMSEIIIKPFIVFDEQVIVASAEKKVL